MDYSIIQPPFTLKFREMSRSELKKYQEWFLGILPERLEELSIAVRQVFGAWQPDLSPASLDDLGRWFASEVDTRERSGEEIVAIETASTIPLDVPRKELTNRTFSIAMDVGMYFAETLRKHHPALQWQQSFSNKKSIDYGQPVLVGFGAVPLNPVQVMVTLAYSIAAGKQSGKRLGELHEIWKKMID